VAGDDEAEHDAWALVHGGAATVVASLLSGSLSSCERLGLSGSSSIFTERRLLHPKMSIDLKHPLDKHRSAIISLFVPF
jgi:hypothetical protein